MMCSDWDFNLRMLQKFEIAVLPQKLAFYHWRPKLEASEYSNSVIAGLCHHHTNFGKIQNDALRAETNQTRLPGAGTTANISKSLSALNERISHVETCLFAFERGRENFPP